MWRPLGVDCAACVLPNHPSNEPPQTPFEAGRHFTLGSRRIHARARPTSSCSDKNSLKGGKKTRDGRTLISASPPPLRKTCVHPLCAPHSSHPIKFLFALGTRPLSPECAFGAAQTCHSVTRRDDSHRGQASSHALASHLHFSAESLCFLRFPSYLLCLFFTTRAEALPGKTGHHACVSFGSCTRLA